MMFSCVQCGQCLDACDETQTAQAREPLLEWKLGADAVRETLRQRKAELEREHAPAPLRAVPPGEGVPTSNPPKPVLRRAPDAGSALAVTETEH
jgi:polyferredoxin